MSTYNDARVTLALEPYGFKDGKYGDVPYKLLYHALSIEQTDYTAAYYIMADHRSMGEVWVPYDGGIEVRLRLANWLNPPSFDYIMGKPVFMGAIRTDVKVHYDKLVIVKLEHGW